MDVQIAGTLTSFVTDTAKSEAEVLLSHAEVIVGTFRPEAIAALASRGVSESDAALYIAKAALDKVAAARV